MKPDFCKTYFICFQDGENSIGSLEGPLATEDIDTSNGVMYIFYDADTNVVYLAGKVCSLCNILLWYTKITHFGENIWELSYLLVRNGNSNMYLLLPSC